MDARVSSQRSRFIKIAKPHHQLNNKSNPLNSRLHLMTLITQSTWPWLKDCGLTIAEPIHPIDEFDDRPSVKSLILKYRNPIDQVRDELLSEPLYCTNKHDDLWILRFVISHKENLKAATKAAKYTMTFRKEHRLDEKDIRYMLPNHNESLQRYLKYVDDDAIRFVCPDQQRGIITFIDIAGVDQHSLVSNVDESDWLPSYLHFTEQAFQWLDYITRTTGRLTKSIRIIDASNIKLNSLNIELSRRDGKVMNLAQDCYPQLLQSMFICDAPCWLQVPWRIIRPLFPKRVTSKFDFILPATNNHERELLLRHISDDHLPIRYGGLNKQWPVEFPFN
jgi:hypothetical protein